MAQCLRRGLEADCMYVQPTEWDGVFEEWIRRVAVEWAYGKKVRGRGGMEWLTTLHNLK